MAEILKRTEAAPALYPEIWPGLRNGPLTWARIEEYMAWRFSPRAVVWIIEGPGPWSPDLAPTTIESVEVWTGASWEDAFPEGSPLGGHDFAQVGPYRITATVGGGDVPATVQEAVRRLDAYLAEAAGRAGTGRSETQLGDIRESYDRAATWRARGIINSGAGDLLRPYRRA